MLQAQITSALKAARVACKKVAYNPIPQFDQLTEYVYETDVTQSKEGITIRLAKGIVKQDVLLDEKPIEARK